MAGLSKRSQEEDRVLMLLLRVKSTVFGHTFNWKLAYDVTRFYIQITYRAKCSKTGKEESWKGRKWYLTQYMTDDEIVKTAWCAFRAAIEHEMMEGFLVDGKPLFNPHTHFEALLSVSDKEVRRTEPINENKETQTTEEINKAS